MKKAFTNDECFFQPTLYDQARPTNYNAQVRNKQLQK